MRAERLPRAFGPRVMIVGWFGVRRSATARLGAVGDRRERSLWFRGGRTTRRGCRPCCRCGARSATPMAAWGQPAGHRHDADRLGPRPGRLPGAGQRDLLHHHGRRHDQLRLRFRRAAHWGDNERATLDLQLGCQRQPRSLTPTATRTRHTTSSGRTTARCSTAKTLPAMTSDGKGNWSSPIRRPGDIDRFLRRTVATDIRCTMGRPGRLQEAVEYPQRLFGLQRQPSRPRSSTTFTTPRTAGSARTSCNGTGVIEHETRFAYDGNEIILQFDKDLRPLDRAQPE